MRARALEAARLEPGLKVLDAGAGTGFTTEGIVARAHAADVTMLDQSPHQLKRSAPSPRWRTARGCWATPRRCRSRDDSFDRYVSAGSIEYWPDPQQGIAEAYRVTRAGGTALMIGPVRPANRAARALAEAWMLFPPVEDYTGWMEAAGVHGRAVVELAPDWYRDTRVPYALAVSGVKPVAGPSPAARMAGGRGAPAGPLKFAARFIAGSAAGAAFVPIAAVLALRARRERQAAT